MYEIVKASNKDAVAISKMLYASLMNGVDGNFSLSKEKVLNHVIEVITSNDGFSVILKFNDDTVGCFMGQLTPHKYALGYIATVPCRYCGDVVWEGTRSSLGLGRTTWSENATKTSSKWTSGPLMDPKVRPE